jgi:hypothetical protein
MNEAKSHKPSSRLIKPKRENSGMYSLRLIMAFLAAVAIHAPFAFMQGNPPPPPPELDFGETTQAISLPPPDENQPEAIQAIYNWTEINDPTLMILPNHRLGFGLFVPKTEPIEKQPVPPIEEARNNIAPPPVLSVPLDIDVATLSQLLSDNWNDKTEISLPMAQPTTPAHGVFWHSENGRLLLTPPENDAQRQALALSHGVPTQTTAIEIAPSPLLPMPRVIVRRSCGNAELDMVALDAVRLTLAKAGPLPLTPGASPDKPLVLIIDWHL